MASIGQEGGSDEQKQQQQQQQQQQVCTSLGTHFRLSDQDWRDFKRTFHQEHELFEASMVKEIEDKEEREVVMAACRLQMLSSKDADWGRKRRGEDGASEMTEDEGIDHESSPTRSQTLSTTADSQVNHSGQVSNGKIPVSTRASLAEPIAQVQPASAQNSQCPVSSPQQEGSVEPLDETILASAQTCECGGGPASVPWRVGRRLGPVEGENQSRRPVAETADAENAGTDNNDA